MSSVDVPATMSFRAARRWTGRALAVLIVPLLVPVVTVSPAAADPLPIAVEMTATPTSVAPGGTLTYTITATNTEPQVANVRLTDQLTGLKNIVLTSSRGYCTEASLLVTCSGGDMPGHGSTWIVTITGTVTAPSGTYLSNTATFTANWSAQNTSHDYSVNDTTNVPVTGPAPGQLADLATALVGPSTASPGQAADYTLTVYNQGFAKASDVLVSGTVPPGFGLQSGKAINGTSLFVCDVALPSFTCLGGAINAGANATINLPLVVSATTPPPDGLTYKLTATVDPENAIAEPDDLQSNANNTSEKVTYVPAGPAPTEPITFTKSASTAVDPATGAQVRIGDVLTYSIRAQNTSTKQTATRLIISDGTQGLDQASVTATSSDPKLPCVNSNNLVTCQGSANGYTLAAGSAVTVTIKGRVVQPPSSIITNTGTLQTLQNKVSITRRASVTTIVRPPVDLTVTQFSTCAKASLLEEGTPGGCLPFRARNQFDYLVTVGNSGLDDAKNVVIREPLPADVIYEGFTNLSPSGGFACSESGSSPVVVTCTGGSVPGQLSSGIYGGTTRQLRLHLTAPNSTGPIASTVYVDPYNATAESDETNNTFTTTTPIATGIDLHISQKLSCPRQSVVTDICDPVAPSGTVVYSLLVQNLGTQDAANIKVSDLLPAGTRFRSAKEINGAVFGLPYTPNHDVSCSSDGAARVDCTGGRIKGIYAAYGGPKLPPPGTPDGFTIQITAFAPAPYGPASSPAATGSPILNQALVDPDQALPEFVDGNNLNILETNVGIPPTPGDQGTFHELTVVNEQVSPAASEAVAPNGTLKYQLTVSNWGSDPVSNVTVVDHLPAGARFRDVTAAPLSNGTGGFGCSYGSGILTCTNGSLAASPGIGSPTSTTITILLFAPGTLSDATTTYTNHAVVDPANAVAEANETNDISDVGLTVKMPDDGGKNAYNELSVLNEQTNPASGKAVTPNGTLEYTLTARNTGSDIAQNVTVYDYVPHGARFRNVTVQPYGGAGTSGGFVCSFTTGLLTCNSGTLAGGGSATIKVLLFAPETPSSMTQFYTNHAVIDPNNASPEADESNNATDTDLTVNIDGENAFHELDVSQVQSFPTSDGAVAPGGTVRYVLSAHNTGSDTAFNVSVRDYLPQDSVFRKARLLGAAGGTTAGVTGFVCTPSAGIVDCTNGTLPSGSTAAIEILLFAPEQPSSPGSETTILNQAVVDVGNAVAEANESNNTSTKETTVALGGAGAFWDLAVADNASPTTGTPDSGIKWSFTVENLGTDDLFNAVVSDTLPAGVTYVGAGEPAGTPSNGRFTCSESGGVITCSGGTLKGTANGGGARTINVLVRAPHENIFIANQAMADPEDTVVEADETNNSYRVITDIQSVIDLEAAITKTGSFGAGDTGNVIGHIRNLGSAPAYDVAFEMSLPVGVTPLDVLAPANTSCQIHQNPISKIVCTAAIVNAGDDLEVDASVYSNTDDAKNANALVNGDNHVVETDDGVHGNNTAQESL